MCGGLYDLNDLLKLLTVLNIGHSESLPENICGVKAIDCGWLRHAVQSPFIRAMGCRYLRCAT